MTVYNIHMYIYIYRDIDIYIYICIWLVVWTLLKILVSWDDDSQYIYIYIWKNIKCSKPPISIYIYTHYITANDLYPHEIAIFLWKWNSMDFHQRTIAMVGASFSGSRCPPPNPDPPFCATPPQQPLRIGIMAPNPNLWGSLYNTNTTKERCMNNIMNMSINIYIYTHT